jgi:hypothetical protein
MPLKTAALPNNHRSIVVLPGLVVRILSFGPSNITTNPPIKIIKNTIIPIIVVLYFLNLGIRNGIIAKGKELRQKIMNKRTDDLFCNLGNRMGSTVNTENIKMRK